MNLIIDNIMFIPIAAYIIHYFYSFYSNFYKTNRNTMTDQELIGNFIYMKKALKK